jgi:hypothetical protein
MLDAVSGRLFGPRGDRCVGGLRCRAVPDEAASSSGMAGLVNALGGGSAGHAGKSGLTADR